MTSTLRSLGLGLALIGAASCDSFQGKWEAFVYPRSDRGRAVYVGKVQDARALSGGGSRRAPRASRGRLRVRAELQGPERDQRVLAHRALTSREPLNCELQ